MVYEIFLILSYEKEKVNCANVTSQLPTTFDGICHSISFTV